jgi:hypothetical protein
VFTISIVFMPVCTAVHSSSTPWPVLMVAEMSSLGAVSSHDESDIVARTQNRIILGDLRHCFSTSRSRLMVSLLLIWEDGAAGWDGLSRPTK